MFAPFETRFKGAVNKFARIERGNSDNIANRAELEGLYEELLDIHHRTVRNITLATTESMFELDYARKYLQDKARTMTMMRAAVRLIDHTIEERKPGTYDWITGIEAGCSTGFFAGFMAALDERIGIRAFEINTRAIAVTEQFICQIGLDNRVRVKQQDLIRNPYTDEAHFAIAEHISRALLEEHATRLPRSIQKLNPNSCIPYSVKPLACTGLNLGSSLSFCGLKTEIIPRDSIQYLLGQDIVLADQTSSSSFSVEGEVKVSPGITPIFVGNDITWLAPHLDPLGHFTRGTRQLMQKWLDGEYESNPENEDQYLLGVTCLSEEKLQLRADKVHCLVNDTGRGVLTQVRINYPIGVQALEKGASINVSVSNPAVTTAILNTAEVHKSKL